MAANTTGLFLEDSQGVIDLKESLTHMLLVANLTFTK